MDISPVHLYTSSFTNQKKNSKILKSFQIPNSANGLFPSFPSKRNDVGPPLVLGGAVPVFVAPGKLTAALLWHSGAGDGWWFKV